MIVMRRERGGVVIEAGSSRLLENIKYSLMLDISDYRDHFLFWSAGFVQW